MTLEWHDWNEDAFAPAREKDVPVLLFVKASWCRWCRQLEDEVLADERVTSILEERFIAIRIDKDRRPDVEAQYSKGGWPTLAYLDDAAELLAADNYLELEPLCERLNLVADYYSENRDTIRARVKEAEATRKAEELAAAEVRVGPRARTASLSFDIVDHVAKTALESSDPKYGGWGERHKFPHPEAIDFALIRWSQTGDMKMLDLVTRTLRHMQAGDIYDSTGGGFYRYATQPA